MEIPQGTACELTGWREAQGQRQESAVRTPRPFSVVVGGQLGVGMKGFLEKQGAGLGDVVKATTNVTDTRGLPTTSNAEAKYLQSWHSRRASWLALHSQRSRAS